MSSGYLRRLQETIKKHEKWRGKECLNLIPAENLSSPFSRSMFNTDLGNRYTAPDKFYRGTKYLDEVESLAEEVARKLFRAKYADVRALAGHSANMAVLLSLAARGDKILSMSPDEGGYAGISDQGLGKLLGLENLYFPFDKLAVNIDAVKAADLIRSSNPRLIFFGSSFILFPQPTRQLSDLSNGISIYDGSHVLGLIAGGEFQDPLREGCSLLIGSTHKSLPGPQGGIILSNDEEAFSKVSGNMYPGMVDNIHLNRVAALTVALLEMMEFGKDYARAVVRNSRSLARSLAREGMPVRGAAHGYTDSHQVLLDYDPEMTKEYSRRLEKANIIVDIGGRVGTAELTRMGYGPKEMEEVAELIGLIVLGRKPPDIVAKRVKSLVRQFWEPKYVLRSVPKELE
jgi:glycine hydroxymethyltransferase